MSRKLIFSLTKKDFDIQWFSGTGAGGQKRNKTQNCCRMIHRESGASSTGQSNKERPSNQKEAFNGLINSAKFKLWHHAKINEVLTGRSINDRVEEAMSPENIRVECKIDGKWSQDCPEL